MISSSSTAPLRVTRSFEDSLISVSQQMALWLFTARVSTLSGRRHTSRILLLRLASYCSLYLSWTWSHWYSHRHLPDEALQVHGSGGHCLDQDLSARICHRTTAKLPGGVSGSTRAEECNRHWAREATLNIWLFFY